MQAWMRQISAHLMGFCCAFKGRQNLIAVEVGIHLVCVVFFLQKNVGFVKEKKCALTNLKLCWAFEQKAILSKSFIGNVLHRAKT